MNYDELIDEIDIIYENLCNSIIKCNFSVSDLEAFKHSNKELHQNLYFQDYLRLRTMASIMVYHNHLRETLLKCAQIDIGDIS